MQQKKKAEKVHRISVSLPENVFLQLDQMVRERGFESRSQAITEMVNQGLNEHNEKLGNQIMAGTITLVYNNAKSRLKKELAEIEYKYINEVISSLHVLLEHEHTMEVILVQGPADRLRAIANELTACKGVTTGKLALTTTILPPIHPLPQTPTQ